ncbi:MAG TPA: thioredoxin domain-containing protein, partial [Candidatus Krumholzibacteria bacterium]|nr:thioredoxin domain-containing protein [Candidatus Krumholzibacteria bacterium]
RAVIDAFGAQVERAPMAHCALLLAVDFVLGPSFEVVIAGKRDADDVKAMAAAVESVYQPNRVTVFRPQEGAEDVMRMASYTKEQVALEGGRATAYVCRDFACHRPTTDAAEMLKLLSGSG